jgi:poly(3-hydroxybutyrate) depolymerase
MRLRNLAIALLAGALLWQPVSCTKCSESETTSEKSAAAARAKSSEKKRTKRRKRRRPMATRAVEVDGQKRRYSVQPARRSKSKKAPVLLALHDAGRSSRDFTRRSDIRGGTRKLGYILAVPGTGKQGWGPGLCARGAGPGQPKGALGAAAPAAAPANVDLKTPKAEPKGTGVAAASALADVRYVEAVLEDLVKRYRADPKRIYVLGMGAGAAFAERLVSELPGKIAGVVAVNPPSDCPRPGLTKPPEQSVPTLVVTGLDRKPTQAAEPASAQGFGYWLKANDCDPTPQADSGKKNETHYSCSKGRVVQVAVKGNLRKPPRKIGRLYTVRDLHYCFR